MDQVLPFYVTCEKSCIGISYHLSQDQEAVRLLNQFPCCRVTDSPHICPYKVFMVLRKNCLANNRCGNRKIIFFNKFNKFPSKPEALNFNSQNEFPFTLRIYPLNYLLHGLIKYF